MSHDSNSSQEHWSKVYSTKAVDSVSWYQDEPSESLALIVKSAPPPASVLDVGGGAALLVDHLLSRGYIAGVLDIANEPLDLVRKRLGPAASDVEWFVADITTFTSPHVWDVWHDRAVFHFLTEEADKAAYRNVLMNSTRSGAAVIIATFAADGPTQCSGLPTTRYSPEELHQVLGSSFELVETAWEDHQTPGGAVQQFVYCRFRRV